MRDEIKLIFMATDIQGFYKCLYFKNLDKNIEDVNKIKILALNKNIPIIYGFKRFAVKSLFNIGKAVSCVGVLNYESLEETVNLLLELIQ